MRKTAVHKNMLVLGGLLFLSQVIALPVAQAAWFPIDTQPTYVQAATSASPIVFNLPASTSDNLIKVVETLGEAFTIKAAEAQDTTVQSLTEVKDDAEPTADQIKSYVLAEVQKAGLNPKQADALISCESKWDDQAKGHNTNGTYDLGLWQINSIHKDISNTDKLDYKQATKWAIAKRLNDGNWSAWSCSRRIAMR